MTTHPDPSLVRSVQVSHLVQFVIKTFLRFIQQIPAAGLCALVDLNNYSPPTTAQRIGAGIRNIVVLEIKLNEGFMMAILKHGILGTCS